MSNPNTSEQLKEKLVAHIQDVYVMEQEFGKMLDSFDKPITEFKRFPEFRARVLGCLDECKEHTTHMRELLDFYKVQVPTGRKFSSPFFGNFITFFSTLKPVSFSDYATTLYTFTQFEIAQYRMLTTLALACGDNETIRIAEEHLRTEIETQRWLFERLPEVCLYSLEYEGVNVPQNSWESARQLELVGSAATFPTFSAHVPETTIR